MKYVYYAGLMIAGAIILTGSAEFEGIITILGLVMVLSGTLLPAAELVCNKIKAIKKAETAEQDTNKK